MLATWWCLWCYKSVFGEIKDILFQNTVIVQFGSIFGLCMHKELINVDICNSSLEYVKISIIVCKIVFGKTKLFIV